MKTKTPYAFFLANAGYSYNPATETPIQGRRRGARELAHAERWANDNGYSFQWIEDDELFECACDNPDCESHEPHTAYVCLMHNPDGDCVQSLGGVSFGPGNDPWSHDEHCYRRVVEAELALEQMSAEA